ELHSPGQRHGDWQQLDSDRFELANRTELLHPRARLLWQRLRKRLGEHYGIRAECLHYHAADTYGGRFTKAPRRRRYFRSPAAADWQRGSRMPQRWRHKRLSDDL